MVGSPLAHEVVRNPEITGRKVGCEVAVRYSGTRYQTANGRLYEPFEFVENQSLEPFVFSLTIFLLFESKKIGTDRSKQWSI